MIVLIFLSVIVNLLTVELTKSRHFNPISASALITILALLIVRYIFNIGGAELITYEAVIFGSSFVGMTSSIRLSYSLRVVASLIFITIFTMMLPFLGGLGGALGFSAFLSVLLTKLLGYLLRKLGALHVKAGS